MLGVFWKGCPRQPAASLLGFPNIVSSFEAQTLFCFGLLMCAALTIKGKPSAKGLALQQNHGPGVAASSFPQVCASLYAEPLKYR